jgi:hypothetical protein
MNEPQQEKKHKRIVNFDFNTVWNSLLLVTIIGLLITTREDIASIGTILHEREAKIVQIEAKMEEHDNDINDLKVRVGTIERVVEKVEKKEQTTDKVK